MKFSLLDWREFRVKNHLKAGENCMFEFVKDGDVPVLNFYNLGKKRNINHAPVKETNSTIKKAIRDFRCANELDEEEILILQIFFSRYKSSDSFDPAFNVLDPLNQPTFHRSFNPKSLLS
ncbi:hypothetical protein L6452_29057 [Arctium lappa]|uniref:Uncharacterized protein n=1 Tax=Arctium lappa TaxID=4217 RepID=A0ACB8ZH29_ARCLA|nr:hypothetical protein L6452_29057 [Arctium lappa]